MYCYNKIISQNVRMRISTKLTFLNFLFLPRYACTIFVILLSLTFFDIPVSLYAKNLEGFTYEEEQHIRKESENLLLRLENRDRMERKIHEPKATATNGHGGYIFWGLLFLGVCFYAYKKNRESAREKALALAARERERKADEEEQGRKKKLVKVVNSAMMSGLNIDDCTKRCDDCGELIKLMAKRCRFCGCRYTKDEILQSAFDISENYLLKNKKTKPPIF